MLFWHVALLFSVLCTSVLASPDGNHETSQGDNNLPMKEFVTFEELQGCWVGSDKMHVSEFILSDMNLTHRRHKKGENDVANKFLAIQGGRIVYTTDDLAKKIRENPKALDSTHWIPHLEVEVSGMP